MWSLLCDENITEGTGNSLYEWLNNYKNWGTAIVKNRDMAKKCRVSWTDIIINTCRDDANGVMMKFHFYFYFFQPAGSPWESS